MTCAPLNEFTEFNSGFIPEIFLFIFLFSVRAIILKALSFFDDLMSC